VFLESFRITGVAVLEIFLLGAVGYFLMKKEFLGAECLDNLSRLVINVTLPALIFVQLIEKFSFSAYPRWWIFPLASLAITLVGFAAGFLFSGLLRGETHRRQFISLAAFQNSGYLPLALVAALLPQEQVEVMFVYLFLLLLGFNLLIWSVGVRMLFSAKTGRLRAADIFTTPVLATIISLIAVFFGVDKFLPGFLTKPLRMVGDCTLPLAMFVVGGSLAQIRLRHIDRKALAFLLLAKLLILPSLGLFFALRFNLPELIGLLIVIQLAMPPATSLSLIIRRYGQEDLLISQGIFFGHLASIITLPLFLSLYFSLKVVQ